MKKSRFPAPGEFTKTLKERVNSYFAENQKSITGDYRIFTKSIFIFILFVGSYTTLYYLNVPLWVKIIMMFTLAQSKVLIGFNIMHDGNHGSYSSRKWVNTLTGITIDLIGGSSYLWKHKHNVLHHTYTNINGIDNDLQTEGLIRLSPEQPWKPMHRFQHIYGLMLYAITTFHWFLFNDYKQIITKKMGNSTIPKLKKKDIMLFIFGKLFYYTYMIFIPLQFNSWQFVLTTFIVIHIIVSITLAVIFQLAHTLEDNAFPAAESPTGMYDNEWSLHQLATTANFAPTSRFATWYMGGLNHQIEHHLFPKMSHVHYPDIAPIVKDICKEYNVKYTEYPTISHAFYQHLQFLKIMGQNR